MYDQETNEQKLSEYGEWQLHDDSQDIRGRQLRTNSGAELGAISDMLIDTERERVCAVVLDNGRSFPVETLEIRDDAVITYEPGAEPEPSVTLYEARLIRPIP